ncbi:MAG: hypothetical protein KDB00_13830 [Planctomycetales bacterium]|nr:hypothetical protein [Planctomycetales bacterium]
MATKFDWAATFAACVVVLGLGNNLCGGDPVSGKQLFEKQWHWNPSAESLDETDFQNAVPKKVTELPVKQPLEQVEELVRQQDPGKAAEMLQAMLPRNPQPGGPPLRNAARFDQKADGDGLGPLHNATSCAACHDGGGGSGVEHNVTLVTVDPRSDFFKQLGPDSGKTIMEFFPGLIASRGGLSFNMVVHDASTRPGYSEIRNRLGEFVPGEIDKAWFNQHRRTSEAISKQPVVAGRYKTLDYYLSQRNSPPLFGLGQIDSISVGRMNSVATRQAALTEGKVTGRVAGKFGWRGQVDTLDQFVRGACAGELGLNQGLAASQASDPADLNYNSPKLDITPLQVAKLTSFVASLPKPIELVPDGHTRQTVRSGEKIFHSIGCAICHVPDMIPVTGLFSDLLLHDMGSELQAPFPAPAGQLGSIGLVDPVQFTGDPQRRIVRAPGYYGAVFQTQPPLPYPFPRPDEPQFPRGELTDEELAGIASTTWDAMQREWKTPPLWGVADSAPYLHDGRAATLDQAIVWHGGESAASRQKYERLNQRQKEKLIAFLLSLRSPTASPTLAVNR